MARNDDERNRFPSSYSQPTGGGSTGVKKTNDTVRNARRESVPIIYQDEAPERTKKSEAPGTKPAAGTPAKTETVRKVKRTESEVNRKVKQTESEVNRKVKQTDRPVRETDAQHEERIRRAEKAANRGDDSIAQATDLPEEEPGKEGKKKRKKHRFLKFLLWLILIVSLVEFGVIYYFTGKANIKPKTEIAEEDSYGLPGKYEKGVTNILLIGTDARIVGEDSRSDSMIIVSICPLQHKMYLTSVLRDSYVDIPGYGKNRLNHAYQMGGGKLLTQTIEQNFGIRIDGYMAVDFYSFIEIIDAIGGVEIDVTAPEVHYVDAYLSEINQLMGIPAQDSFIYKEGVYNLSGRQALAYGRIRYIGTDFGRTNRQRTVIQAALKKTVRTNPLKWPGIVNTIMENITTDMSRVQMTLLAMRVPFLATYRIESNQIPYDNTWWNDTMPNGQEVLSMDMEAVIRTFREKVYGK